MDEVTFETDLKLWMKVKVKVKLLSRVWFFGTPWTVTYQAPPSMGFSRQEYWSGLAFPPPGDLPDPWTEPGSPGEFHEQRSLVGYKSVECKEVPEQLTLTSARLLMINPLFSFF